MNPVLEIKGLVAEFVSRNGTFRAVDDLSLSLDKGRVLAVVGESGSGKSVTALSILNLLAQPAGQISAGEILYYPEKGTSIDLAKLNRDEIRKYRGNEISMIFQEPMTSLNPVFTCGYQVAESLMLHLHLSKKEAKIHTIELFKKVMLPRPEFIFDAYPHEVSGGQKQRVMIAMAIACNPSVLIADEPTTALDVTVQKAIIELLDNLRQSLDMSVIFITHDLGLVANFADDVVVMHKGKIVESGPVKKVFDHPSHPYTQGLLQCRPRMDVRLKKLPIIDDFLSESDGPREAKASNIETYEAYLSRQKQFESAKTILRVTHLKKYYPLERNFFGKPTAWVKAVDDVSFEVKEGETMGLVGESGCGKSTLGRTILGLIPATSGKVEFDGTELTALSPKKLRHLRKDIQIIFQDPYSSLNPRMTIGNAITEPMKVHGMYNDEVGRKNKALELLERVDLLPEHFQRYPHEFSGGQRQRVCIARALALQPRFIICDESVSALDVSVQAQVLNLLNELKRDFGFTYIFISHDLSVVKFMSDRLLVMKNGKIEEAGLSEEIYRNPQSDYTKELISAIP